MDALSAIDILVGTHAETSLYERCHEASSRQHSSRSLTVAIDIHSTQ